MRIKPVVVTGATVIIALSAVALVVFSTTPDQASNGIIWLLWLAIFLVLWGLSSTVLLLFRRVLSLAMWAGLIFSIIVVIALVLFKSGMLQ